MDLYKLVNGVPVSFSARSLRVGTRVVANPAPELLIAQGWKPIAYAADTPEYDPETQQLLPQYAEGADAITVTYAVADLPASPASVPAPLTTAERLDEIEAAMMELAEIIAGGAE